MAFGKMGARGGFGSAGVLGGANLPRISWPGTLSPTTYNGAVLAEPNLVAFWPLNDASGATSFADLKGGRSAAIQNKGTGVLLAQTGLIPADSNTSAKFVTASSGDGLVSVSDSAGLDFDGSAALSIEAIVNPNITRSGGQTIHALFAKQSQNSPFAGYELELRWDGTSATRLQLDLVNTGTTNQASIRGMTTDFQNGTSYHVCATYDGSKSTNGMSIATNGVPENFTGGIINNNLTGSISNSAQASIGSRNNSIQFANVTEQAVAIYSDKQLIPAIQYRAALALGRTALTPVSWPVDVILDTDISTDVEDVTALYVLIYLTKLGYCNIKAIVTSTSNDYGAPCVEAILKHFGITNVPIGAYQGASLPSTSSFTSQVASRFGVGGKTRANYSDATTVLRTALAALADGGNLIVPTIGALTNISVLRQSSSDGISALTGAQLIANKVRRINTMGGDYPSSTTAPGGIEANFSKDAAATADVFSNITNEIVCNGYSIGSTVMCGPPASSDPLTSPIKYAYDLYQAATGQLVNGERATWDSLSVLYAVLGDIIGFQTGGLRGTNTINGSTGANTFSMTSGNTSYVMKRASDATLRANLNTILAAMR